MGIWAELSRQGNGEAEFGLGLFYDLGNGTQTNPESAFFWYKRAAEAGLPALGTTASSPSAGPLTAVTLVSPARDVSLPPTDGDPTVELVWVAPPQPQQVQYEIRVFELGGQTMRTVFTGSIPETATAVRLPSNAGFYAWNVHTVARDGSHAPGDWSWFSVGSPRPPEQSMAAGPEASKGTR
jgi:hypothetical protein